MLFSVASVAAAGPETVPAHEPKAELEVLRMLSIPVSEGAAAGYVPDRVCGTCHAPIFDGFQDVGMARSFYRPRADRLVEPFGETFFHAASDRFYRIERRNDELVFRRWQEDAGGGPIHEIEIPVDWILGSGNKSRTYLYRDPQGELYQLPIAWYSEPSRWGMAPGFDDSDHEGVGRLVRRQCLFCHNAYPEVPVGADDHHDGHSVPASLPEGIGCQRCHGPGARHAALAMRHDEDREAVRNAIFDPSRLPFERRHEVCYQCHLQPSVALFGVRRFDRGDYSFRPWEPLADYLVHVDPTEAGHDRSERFEINHHAYRMRQSPCFLESGGALGCLTCHDPHRKVREADRLEHYRAACLTCHQEEACSRPEEHGTSAIAGDHATVPGAPADCVSCHMPQRRAQDVVQVTVTDHRITKRPPPDEQLLAPLEETVPILEDVRLLDPHAVRDPYLAEIYRTVAVLRAAPDPEAAAHLEVLLGDRTPSIDTPTLLYDLADAQIVQGRFAEADRTLDRIEARFGSSIEVREYRALARAGRGDRSGAVGLLQAAVETEPDRASSRYNLGHFLLGLDRPADAVPHLEAATKLRPNLTRAWLDLAEARRLTDDREGALAAARHALALDPRSTEGYRKLVSLLRELDRTAEAERYLRHGREQARNPAALADLR